MTQAAPFVEREHALAVLRRRVADARRGAGSVVAVTGQPGIGRTALLRELRAGPADAAVTWLHAAGRESEREYPFGGALQLIGPAWAAFSPAERDELLATAPAAARTLLAGEVPDPSGPAALFTQVNALFWVLARVAERTPLAVCIDDTQWLDAPTLTLLAFLAERVAELPVALVCCVRTGEPGPPPQLRKLLELGALDFLELQKLSAEGVGAVVEALLERTPAPEFVATCAAVTRGLPVLVREVTGEFVRTGLEPNADAAETLAALQPPSVTRGIRRRFARLTPVAQQFACALAVLGRAPLELTANVAGQTRATAARAVDELAAAAIVVPAAGAVEFTHPLARAAVNETVGPGQRVHLNARAAAHLLETHAPADRVAAHLLETSGANDAAYVAVLREAARDAIASGDPSAAAAMSRRALQMPSSAPWRPELLAECGRAACAAGDAEGPELLLQAATLTADPASAAERRLEAAAILLRRVETERMMQVTEPVIADARLPEQLRRDARALRLSGVVLAPELAERVDDSLEALIGAGQEPGSQAERSLLATTAVFRAMRGTIDAAEAQALVQRSYGQGALLDGALDVVAVSFVAGVSAATGALQDALEMGDELVRRAKRAGSLPELAVSSYMRGYARTLMGSHREALADLDIALGPGGHEAYAPAAIAYATRAWLELDDLAAAAAMHARCVSESSAPSSALGYWKVAGAKLALMRNQPAKALEYAYGAREDLPRRLPGPGGDWPLVMGEALSLLGRREESLAVLDEEIARLERWGAPGPLGMAKRSRGRVLGTEDEAMPLLWEAVELLAVSEFRGDHARALIDLGWALRRAGRRRDSVVQLRIGLELAGELGLVRGERIAREELAAAGYRPRRTALSGVDALTPSERRVCELAARGATNREIAQTLFVTIKAVEKHLANAYPKLEIRSRRELPAALAEPPSDDLRVDRRLA